VKNVVRAGVFFWVSEVRKNRVSTRCYVFRRSAASRCHETAPGV
jgi:hypothetical protein